MTLSSAVEAGARAAREADVLAIESYPGNGVKIGDYLVYNASEAIELGVHLTERTEDGKPRFHWYSDIRNDEHGEVEEAILRPCIEAALRAALPIIGDDLISIIEAEIATQAHHGHAVAKSRTGRDKANASIRTCEKIAAALRLKIKEMMR